MMLAVGNTQKVQQTNRLPLTYGKLKKGKILAKRKTVQEVMVEQEERGTKLPNITTTQLVGATTTKTEDTFQRQYERACQRDNDIRTKPRKFAAATLKNNSFKIEDAETLDGLIVSRLTNNDLDCSQDSDITDTPLSWSPKLKQNCRRSSNMGTDSGFGEDSCDSIADVNHSHSSSISDLAVTNSSPIADSLDIRSMETRNSSRFSNIRPDYSPSKLVVRKAEKISGQARMCTQSQTSLHADMMALKNLSLRRRVQREKQTQNVVSTRPCEEVLIAKQTSSLSPSLSERSLSILKNKQQALSRKCSRPVTCSVDQDIDRVVSANSQTMLEQTWSSTPGLSNEVKKCVRFKLDNLSTSSESGLGNLTEETLSQALCGHKMMDVNSKCNEWLNRWLETSASNQNSQNSNSVQ